MSEPSYSAKRWRPRVSLLTALLLLTIVGLSIVSFGLWREVGPLRLENRRMRAQLGQLRIEDSKKAYAMQLPAYEDNTWRWRIYLPPGGQHVMYDYSGILPARNGRKDKDWFEEMKQSGRGGGTSSGSHLQGEFTIVAKLLKENGRWKVAMSFTPGDSEQSATLTSETGIAQATDDWPGDYRQRGRIANGVGMEQKSFAPGEPMVLLAAQRAVVKKLPGGARRTETTKGPAEGIAIWIEPSKPIQRVKKQ
jgi:hypothetical protein